MVLNLKFAEGYDLVKGMLAPGFEKDGSTDAPCEIKNGGKSLSCWMPKNIIMCRKYVLRRSELLSPSNLRQVLNSQRGM